MKNVTVAVAFQTTFVNAQDSKVFSQCGYGYYGSNGVDGAVQELCAPCPAGATCPGGAVEPIANVGYYIGYEAFVSVVNGSTVLTHDDGCPPELALTRPQGCLLPQPCSPPESCTGNDTCSFEYVSAPPLYRCNSCSKGYFRIANSCRKCPNNVWLLIVGFFVVIVVAGAVGYVLNRKAVNIAFLSIGMDYFQVVAMFARSVSVGWQWGVCSV